MINAQYSISKGWKLFFQGLELSRAPPALRLCEESFHQPNNCN